MVQTENDATTSADTLPHLPEPWRYFRLDMPAVGQQIIIGWMDFPTRETQYVTFADKWKNAAAMARMIWMPMPRNPFLNSDLRNH